MKKLFIFFLILGLFTFANAEDWIRNPDTGERDIVFDKGDEIDIDDAGDYYTGTDVETALQEIGSGTTLDPTYARLDGTNQPFTGAITPPYESWFGDSADACYKITNHTLGAFGTYPTLKAYSTGEVVGNNVGLIADYLAIVDEETGVPTLAFLASDASVYTVLQFDPTAGGIAFVNTGGTDPYVQYWGLPMFAIGTPGNPSGILAGGTGGDTQTALTLGYKWIGDGDANDGIKLTFQHRNTSGVFGQSYDANYMTSVQTDNTPDSEDATLYVGGYTAGISADWLTMTGTKADFAGLDLKTTGNVGIGYEPNSTYKVDIEEEFTNTTGVRAGVYVNVDHDPSGALGGITNLIGSYIQAHWESNNDEATNAYIYGTKSEAVTLSGGFGGDCNTLMGVSGVARHLESGDVTTAVGTQGRVLNDDGVTIETGNITNAYSFLASAYTDKTTGTITTRYGLYIEDTTGGGNLTNQYGIYCPALSGAAGDNYFIKNVSAPSDFGSGTITTTGAGALGLGTTIGSATDYWTFSEADYGIFGKIPLITPTATFVLGSYGAMANGLNILADTPLLTLAKADLSTYTQFAYDTATGILNLNWGGTPALYFTTTSVYPADDNGIDLGISGNAFNDSYIKNIYLENSLIHDGDADTYLSFGADEIDLWAGGFQMGAITPSAITFNVDNQDCDFIVHDDNGSNFIELDANTPRLYLRNGSAGIDPAWNATDICVFESASTANASVQFFTANDKIGAFRFSDTDGRNGGGFGYAHSTDMAFITGQSLLRFYLGDNIIFSGDATNNYIALCNTATPHTPAASLHSDLGNATAAYHKFTAGTTTGQTATDGFDIGIDANGKAILHNFEATDMDITSGAEINFSATVFDFDSNSNSQNIYIRGLDAGTEWANLFVDANDDFNLYVNGGKTILDSNSNAECLRLAGADSANDYADMYVDADSILWLVPNSSTTGGVITNGKLVQTGITVSAAGPTDDVNVAGANIVWINTADNNVTIGGFTGGYDGQVIYVVIEDATNTTTLEHAEGTGNQDIYLSAGVDEPRNSKYGGWVLICNGSNWYECGTDVVS